MDSILQAGIVSASLQAITDRLASLTVQEISVILAPDEEVRKLQRTLERISAIVAHVEQNRSILSNNISNEAWKLWLQHVEELSCSADDLLDGVLLDVAKYKTNLSADADGENQVRSMLLSSLKLTVPRDISRIRRELEEIAKEMDAPFMTELTKLGSNKILKSNYCRARSSLVEEGLVIGREREKNEIVEMLLAEELRDRNVSVIPIVGMGGIGKTTLAQVVYGDNRLTGRFDLRMWVSVSVDFNSISITKSIIESATGERCKLSCPDPVQIKLRDLILGKRFLLVLDDYWSEEYDDWDVLSSPFKVGSRGSKIILTTRSMIVSQIVGTVPQYCLESLSNENCWELMKQRAFSNGLECSLQLEEIGKMIAGKCKGLPLAAKTLGGMLHFKNDPAEWNSILKSEIWDLPPVKNDIFPALTLSYYHLPAHLKKCFAYCSVFPQNYDFEMNELSLLWIAQGFVHASGKKQLEELGNHYFKDLLSRSFFQFSKETAHGQKLYKMHDLIHGMAKLVSGHACYHQEDDRSIEEYPFFKNTRHFSLHCNNRHPLTLEVSPWYKNLRTFRVICENVGKVQVPYYLFLKLKSLRALDFSRMNLEELPYSIDELTHLRYLNLSENPFKQLPESVTKLFGLQTLKLENCNDLLELPSNMKNMVSLRHLHSKLESLDYMPSEFGKLVNLQSLSTFIVGSSQGCGGIGELKNMRFLRGCIRIRKLENVSNLNEAKEAMLHMKPFISKLELEWSEDKSKFNDQEILAGLQPHDDLEELWMINYSGILLPGWFSSPLCKLSRVHLRGCKSYHILASLGKLQHLKSLVIGSMYDCSSIDLEAHTFQSLESLTVEHMPNLTSWTGFHCNSFPRLHTLDIYDCPQLANLPSLVNTAFLQSLKISGCREIRSLPDDRLPVSLQALEILNSGITANTFKTEEGADWQQISRIPKIEIDGVVILPDRRRF